MEVEKPVIFLSFARFYPFKGDKALPILYIHRQSCFLLGRDKAVADIPLEHPSVSKQHAVLQYRATPFTRADGSQGRRVRPYIIDLGTSLRYTSYIAHLVQLSCNRLFCNLALFYLFLDYFL